MSHGTVRVAALQMCSGPEPGPNLEALEGLVAEAAGAGASYVLSPEVTIAMAENREGLERVARPFENNPALAEAGRIARRHAVTLHIGSLAVALRDGRFANRSVVLGPDGRVLAWYDKIHLFDATLPDQRAYRESDTYSPGGRAVVLDTGEFSLGMTICYDVRFPALFQALARAGAKIIAVPAAFTVPTGAAHWDVLLRARAIETGTFVIAAAQGGRHLNGRETYGRSSIVAPWGEVIGRLDHDRPGVLVADLNLDRVAEARSRLPVLRHARPFTVDMLASGEDAGLGPGVETLLGPPGRPEAREPDLREPEAR